MNLARRFCRYVKRAASVAGRGNAGQSLVETALVFPILVTFLVGTADLARVARATIAVSNAAKAGAQYAVQSGFTAQDATGIGNAASAEASNLSLTTSSSYTCVCSDGTTPPTPTGATSNCTNDICSTSHVEETVTVTTQAPVTPLVHLPGLPATYTVHGRAIQRCLQ